MLHSQAINHIAEALAKAQGEMGNPRSEATNAFQKYNYAKADDFLNTIRGPLSKNGISFNMGVETNEHGEMLLSLLLTHSSGQWMKYAMPLRSDLEPGKGMSADQLWGSHLTYRKKSLLSIVFGIHGSEDDDSQDQGPSEDKSPKPATALTKKPSGYQKVNSDNIKQIMFELGEHQDILQRVLESYNVGAVKDLPADSYTKIVERIRLSVSSKQAK